MRRARDIIGALCAAASWLLMVSVVFGVAGGAGVALAATGSDPCSVSCPCDDGPLDEHASEGEAQPGDPCADEHGGEHDDGDGDQCPEDCPNCGCSLGAAAAVIPLPVTSGPTCCTTALQSAPSDALAGGTASGVFRPPRAAS